MRLKKLVEELEKCELEGSMYTYKDCVWMDRQGELLINTERNVKDLREEDGDTYGFSYTHYEHSEDDFFVYHDCDLYDGQKDTIILRGADQVTVEEEA